MAFNTDKGTGKTITRSLMGDGMSEPTQFNATPEIDGSRGTTTNMGPMHGGGMGRANEMAGKAVSPMPRIPKGAIFGSDT